jgi:hypothetical protein
MLDRASDPPSPSTRVGTGSQNTSNFFRGVVGRSTDGDIDIRKDCFP